MKHAFLIIAHGNWKQLKILLKQIDSSNHDIYIHIDAKIKNPPIEFIREGIMLSRIEIVQKFKVYWGSFELVETELFLLEKARKNLEYDYYHLLSGMDLLIKPLNEIDDFFEKNNGYEFVHFDTDDRIKKDKEILRRVQCYHFFTNYRKGFKCKVLNKFFNFLEHISLGLQTILKIDRTKKYNEFVIKYGSQWFSITDNLVSYIIENKDRIYNIFNHTKCADELFIQSLVYNSAYKNRLYDLKYDDNCKANMRLIDLKERSKNGSPYIWRIEDFDEISTSECLFARKFDINVDEKIVNEIIVKNNYGGKIWSK